MIFIFVVSYTEVQLTSKNFFLEE